MGKMKPEMKIPEFMVFLRILSTGFLLAEVWRIASYLGSNYAPIILKKTSGFKPNPFNAIDFMH